MPFTISDALPYAAIIISGLALWRNLKADSKADAGEMTTVIVKLETINENIKEVKTDIKDVKGDMERMKERIVVVEQSVKSAHKRLDGVYENDTE